MREFYGPFHQSVKLAEQEMTRVKIADEPTDEVCEKCGRPMVIKLGKFGRFLACTGFPECRNARPLLIKIGVKCPQCHEGEVVEKRTRKGRQRIFYGCSRYPECDFTSWDKPTGDICPECGDILVETGRDNTIKCRNASCHYRPTQLAKAS